MSRCSTRLVCLRIRFIYLSLGWLACMDGWMDWRRVMFIRWLWATLRRLYSLLCFLHARMDIVSYWLARINEVQVEKCMHHIGPGLLYLFHNMKVKVISRRVYCQNRNFNIPTQVYCHICLEYPVGCVLRPVRLRSFLLSGWKPLCRLWAFII